MNNSGQNGAQPYYITTSIPYVNAKPHLGHALEFVLTDALARYQRWRGAKVRFQSGSDENSLKNVQAAEREGLPVQALVERNAAQFYALRQSLCLSFDDFIRTSSEARHLVGVRKLWQACAQSGDIYKKAYRGLYCVGCEQFYNESELVEGLCPQHGTPPEVVEEENYFFRLSRYADALARLIETDQLRLLPLTRKNEVLSFIRAGLHDFSISRSQARAHGWGVPVPDDPTQVMYVWFDALGNYITALDYATESHLYQTFWRDNPRRVHVIGKDITRFHAIYWPAMLLSAGVPLPSEILIHGFITLAGGKVSKSRGNVIDPVDLAQTYGVDTLRYYLLAEIKASEDGDFTLARFIEAHNANLADQLGNLLSRWLGMVGRYYDGIVPAPPAMTAAEAPLRQTAETLGERIDEALARFAPHEALAAIWALIGAANRYVAEVKPWHLAHDRERNPTAEAQLATTLYTIAETLRLVACYLSPFLPTSAEAISRQLGLSRPGAAAWGGYPPGTTVRPGPLLFPKLSGPDQA
jgi:methionyl-tRNA synthetase